MITYLRTSKGYEPQTIVTLFFSFFAVILWHYWVCLEFPLGSCNHVWHLLRQKVRLIVKIDIEILGGFAAQEAV